MKRTIGILILFLWTALAHANKIDLLSTKEDVVQFLIEKVNTGWENHNAINIAKFIKADIDNNGLTDLLVKETILFVVLDTGNGYEYRHIHAAEKESYEIVDVLHIYNATLLVIRGWPCSDKNLPAKNDTLIFKFGDFIEHNTHPLTADVEEINFKIGNGYPGRVWDLKINVNGWATFEMGGASSIFAGVVDSATFHKLVKTINYINLTTLAERYPGDLVDCVATDQETFTLEVKFKNGQISRLSDYGGQATYGLQNLYRQLFNIAEHLPELR